MGVVSFLSMFYQIKKMRKWAPFPSKTPQISATRDFFLRTHVGVGMARRGALG